MMGVVVDSLPRGQKEFSPLVYQRFGNDTVLEITVRNALHSSQAQKVVVTAPFRQRSKCSELKLGQGPLNKTATFFYTESQSSLDDMYHAAMSHGFDHIVRIHANCPMIPAWLISEVVSKYFVEYGGTNYCVHDGGWGLEIDVLPFHMLASAWTYAEDRTNWVRHFKQPKVIEPAIKNMGIDLIFDSLDKLETWDFLIDGSKKGYDIEDLLQEVANGNKVGTEQQQDPVG